jgi:N-acetylglutamate synthase-like GNAT family acetyltransferase
MKSTVKILPLERVFINDLRDFPPQEWNFDIVKFMNTYYGNQYFHTIIAKIKNEIVGVGSIFLTGKSSWLGNIIVRPDHRRNRIGHKITQYLIDYALSLQCETINLIATEIGQKLYSTLGFNENTKYLFYRGGKTFSSFDNTNIKPIQAADLQDIYEIDSSITGDIRQFMLDMYSSNGYVYKINNKITGFYLPDLGSGVIIAYDIDAGLELMRLKHCNENHESIFPEENTMASDLLLSNNFTEYFSATRMSLGKKYSWKPERIFCRIAGYIG